VNPETPGVTPGVFDSRLPACRREAEALCRLDQGVHAVQQKADFEPSKPERDRLQL
jgi:hypothetical protein